MTRELVTGVVSLPKVNSHINSFRVRVEFDPCKAFIGIWYNSVPAMGMDETWHHIWIAPLPMFAIHVDWHWWGVE